MQKDASYFDAAIVTAVFVAIPGGFFAALGTTNSRNGTEHSILFTFGAVLLALAGLLAIYGVTGWATKRALLEHEAVKAGWAKD